VIKEVKNKVTFELKVFVTEELIRNMLSYGGSLEVVEPIFLRQEMIMRVKTMVENYA
jgi:predicted DNA-binding transcriptional regulator YafY